MHLLLENVISAKISYADSNDLNKAGVCNNVHIRLLVIILSKYV